MGGGSGGDGGTWPSVSVQRDHGKGVDDALGGGARAAEGAAGSGATPGRTGIQLGAGGLERRGVGQLGTSEHNTSERLRAQRTQNPNKAQSKRRLRRVVWSFGERETDASSTAAVAFIRILQVACEGGTRGAMAVLVEVLGQESAVAVVADNPRALTLRVETIRTKMAALVKLMGHREAVAAVEREPHLLSGAGDRIQEGPEGSLPGATRLSC